MPIPNAVLERVKNNDPNLRHLNLSGQGLTDNDIRPLVAALRTNTYITAISVCSFHKKMEQENPDPFVVYLPDGTPRHLHNKLTAESAKLLAGCAGLRWLDMSGNPIGDEGAIALANSKSLIELLSHGCQIGQKGANAFLASPALQELWATQNKFDQHDGEDDNGNKENSWINKLNKRLAHNRAASDEKAQLELSKRHFAENLEKQTIAALDAENIAQLSILIPQLEYGIHTCLMHGCGLLQYATDKRKLKTLCWLLDAGALLEGHEREYTALFEAAENGDYEVVRILLRHGSNITGEFYFNNETAFSIALYKLCYTFRNFLRTHPPKPAKEIADFIRYWDAFASDTATDIPPWVRAGAAPLEMVGHARIVCKYINLFLNPKFPLSNDKIRNDKDIKIAVNYARVFQLLHDKIAIIKKITLMNPDAYFKAIEDEKAAMQQRLQVLPAVHGKALPARDKKTIEQAVLALNAALKSNKEQDIKWQDQPRFFVGQYRCIHYYSNYFDPNQRRDHIVTRHLNRIMPAPAVFMMSSVTPNAHQLLRESRVKHDRVDIIETLEGFRQSGEVKLQGKKFANHDLANQEKLSNDYQGSLDDIRRKTNAANEILFDMKAVGYPHCATSDSLQHTLRYGFGKKTIRGLAQHRLKPEYDAAGKPKNLILGKIYIGLFTPLEMAQHRARHVLGAHNRGLLDLKDTVAPERETSFPGGVLAGQFFYEAALEIPDLSRWDANYVIRFGLQQASCNDYQKRLAAAKSADEREKICDEIILHLISFKEKELLLCAQQEAERRGGILIYRHYDRVYGLEPERIRASDRAPYISQAERVLMATVGAQRFAQTAAPGDSVIEQQKKPAAAAAAQVLPSQHFFPTSDARTAKRTRTIAAEANKYSARPTKGLGDCALHASLGVDNGEEYECKDVLRERAKLARVVADCKQSDAIYPVVLAGIEALVMGGERDTGDYIKQLRATYQNHVLGQGAVLDVAWYIFEKCLMQRHQNIVTHINDSVADEEKRNPDPKRNLNTLRAKFNFCLNIKENNAGETLDALIQSAPELNAAFQNYNQVPKQSFNLAARITMQAIQDYARFVGKSGQWLLPHELELIARTNNIAIKLYTPDDKGGPFSFLKIYNPGATPLVKIRFDGVGHYERMIDTLVQPTVVPAFSAAIPPPNSPIVFGSFAAPVKTHNSVQAAASFPAAAAAAANASTTHHTAKVDAGKKQQTSRPPTVATAAIVKSPALK